MISFLFVTLTMLISHIDCTSRILPLTCDLKKEFVNGHNLHRYNVAQGLVPRQPAAANITYLIWDEELAAKATKWAENGIFKHNPDKTVGSKRWKATGENLYLSRYFSSRPVSVLPDIEEVLEDWFNEHLDYEFGPFRTGYKQPIGHYTQMIWADTSHLGCAISQQTAKDNWKEMLYVCNYGPAGNYLGRLPYNTSTVKGHLHCPDNGFCSKAYGNSC